MLKRTIIRSLLLVMQLCIYPALQAKDWQKEGWEFVSQKEGIKVFRKAFPGSQIKGVGGEALMEGSIGKILWLLQDHERKHEWIDAFLEAKTLSEAGPLENVQYSLFSLPFPVSNRDFVFRNLYSVDPATNSVIIDVKSVTSKEQPEREGIVRGEILVGRYFLTPMGDKTLLQAEYLADPKGFLPSWVVNIFQKQWPYKTLTAMRKQLKKDDIKEWDVYVRELKPKLKLN